MIPWEQIVQTNDMASKTLDFSKESLLGKSIQNFFPTLVKKTKKGHEQVLASSPPFFDQDLQLKNGKILSLRCHLRLAIEKEKQQEAFILIFEDQTPFKEMEKKIRASEKLAAVGKLAASMAHEIRNPLASMRGCIEMLQEEMGIKEQKGGGGINGYRYTRNGSIKSPFI